VQPLGKKSDSMCLWDSQRCFWNWYHFRYQVFISFMNVRDENRTKLIFSFPFYPKIRFPSVLTENHSETDILSTHTVWKNGTEQNYIRYKVFYEQLFHMKVFCAAFMCLQFEFVIFGGKDFGTKSAHNIWTLFIG
jgi:hypothetical protein